MALYRTEPAQALADLAKAASLPIEVRDSHFGVYYGQWSAALYYADKSLAEAMLKQADPALADMKTMIGDEGSNPAPVLNHYCYTAAVGGQFGLAELTCQESIKRQRGDYGSAYDSLGFTYLRQHAWQQAIDAYTKALDRTDDLTLSRYGRGVARIAVKDQGDAADIAEARQREPDIDAIMSRLGAPILATVAAK